MNCLSVGFDRSPLLHHVRQHPGPFLIIDTGEIIDHLTLPKRRVVTVFDPAEHSLNVLKGMDERKAETFLHTLDAIFPEGAQTLTKRYSNHLLFKALLESPKRLDALVGPSKDPYQRDAYEKIERLLLSPVLKRVLNNPTNFPLTGYVLARLDPAVLGSFNCFVLGNFLAMAYPGQVVFSDLGFYGHKGHRELVRQGRLTAHVLSLSQVPDLATELLSIEGISASRATYDDAEILALHAGKKRGLEEFTDFVHFAMRPWALPPGQG